MLSGLRSKIFQVVQFEEFLKMSHHALVVTSRDFDPVVRFHIDFALSTLDGIISDQFVLPTQSTYPKIQII